MKNEGWSWGDLAGELMVRGIDPDDVDNDSIMESLNRHTPEQAAQQIERDYNRVPQKKE